jgi:hypothetical protein
VAPGSKHLEHYTKSKAALWEHKILPEKNEIRKHCPVLKTHSVVGQCMACFTLIKHLHFIVNYETHMKKDAPVLF